MYRAQRQVSEGMRLSLWKDRRRWPNTSIFGCTAVMGLLVLGGTQATAQTSSTFQVTAIRLYDESASNLGLTENELVTYPRFNYARCSCAQQPQQIRIEIDYVPDRSSTDLFYLLAGSNCWNSSTQQIESRCKRIVDGEKISNLPQPYVVYASIEQFWASASGSSCRIEDSSLELIPFAGPSSSLATAGTTIAYRIDGDPPTVPVADGDVAVGEERLSAAFSKGLDSEEDVQFQLLCSKADGTPWRNTVTFDPGFLDPTAVCTAADGSDASLVTDGSVGSTTAALGEISDGGTSDAALDAGTTAADLGSDSDIGSTTDSSTTDSSTATSSAMLRDPRYVCSNTLTAASRTAVEGLVNGVTYNIYVVAFDRAKNATEPLLLGTGTPTATEDLWERYKRSGGQADGGYCNVGPTPSGLWLALAGIAGLMIGLQLRRRRRKRAVTPTAPEGNR